MIVYKVLSFKIKKKKFFKETIDFFNTLTWVKIKAITLVKNVMIKVKNPLKIKKMVSTITF